MEPIATALTALAIGLGIWMSLRGRPLSMLLSIFHKLAAAGAAVFTALLLFGGAGFGALPQAKQAAGVTALVAIVALFATGAVLSGKERKKGLMWVHGVGTVIVFAGSSVLTFL